MWKSDAQVKQQEEARLAHRCADGRDEWRTWARSRDLIPRKTKHPKTRLWARKIVHEFCRPKNRLVARLRSSIGASQSQSPLMSLPPEIRELIYMYCVEDWHFTRPKRAHHTNSMALPPHEPPITRVARLIRLESLAVFYRTYRFPLIFHLQNNLLDPRFVPVEWYYFLGPEKLCMIRHLQLHLCGKSNIHTRILDPIKINVDLGRDNVSVYWMNDQWLFRRWQGPPVGKFGQFMGQQSRLAINSNEEQFLNELIQKVQAVAQRIGPTGFVSAHDIYEFVE